MNAPSPLVFIDLADALTLAQNLQDHLQYETEDDAFDWEELLCRLNDAIKHAE